MRHITSSSTIRTWPKIRHRIERLLEGLGPDALYLSTSEYCAYLRFALSRGPKRERSRIVDDEKQFQGRAAALKRDGVAHWMTLNLRDQDGKCRGFSRLQRYDHLNRHGSGRRILSGDGSEADY